MDEVKIDFIFIWVNGMPPRNPMHLFHFIDGETYEVDVLGHINGKFVVFDDIHAQFPSHQRLALTEPNLEELRKFRITWKTLKIS
jgi:hypothetical protein